MTYSDKNKQREYQRAFLRRRREKWLADNGPCRVCGSTKNLTVDHKESKDKVTHNVWSWSEVRRSAELAKCQVLCESCHKKKTLENQEYAVNAEHGNYTMYVKYKCKCRLCVEWKRRSNRRYRLGPQPDLVG